MSAEKFRTEDGANAWGALLNARGFAGIIYQEDGSWVADFPAHVQEPTLGDWPAPDYWCTVCNRGAEACEHTPADIARIDRKARSIA